MAQIDREGTYRGHAVEVAVNSTKNGFPQLVLRFAADELYDSETEQWVPWDEYGQDIIGYFVLFGGSGKCRKFEQVQKALGWDGASFEGLDQLDPEGLTFQLRVEWEEYNGTKSLKATWIDAADASPGGAGLKKIDTTALKALDAQYGGQLGAKKVTPKKAAKGKPPAPPKAKSPPKKAKPKKAETVYPPDETPAEPEAKVEEPKAETPPPPATRGKKAEQGSGLPDACSREEAWAKILELKMASVTDDRLSEAWIAAIDKVAGSDVDGDDVSRDQWAKIRDEVLNTIPSIPF